MASVYSHLPEPTPLRRTAAWVTFQWRQRTFTVICSACSVRFLEWDETHECLPWRHCLAAQVEDVQKGGPLSMYTMLLPCSTSR